MLLSLDGDEAAYRCLLTVLRHLLERYYGWRLGRLDRSEVDDLVQETLLALHQRRITYDRDRPFTAWFFPIARHKLVDHHRRSGGRGQVGPEVVDEMADGCREDAVSAQMDIRRLLAGFPAWRAEAIRQVRLDGRSITEAARRAGRSESMVKVGIHRGIKELAARLRGDHDKDHDLIEKLVRDLRPVRLHALASLLARALLPKMALSTSFILFGHGLPPDLGAPLFVPAFWVKSGYPLLLALICPGALIAVARPGGRPLGSALQVRSSMRCLSRSPFCSCGRPPRRKRATASSWAFPLSIAR